MRTSPVLLKLFLPVAVCFFIYTGAASAQTPKPTPVNVGLLNGKAVTLVQPVYPPAAIEKGVSGAVNLTLVIDEKGDVISAEATAGDDLLKGAAVVAASKSKFSPYLVSGKPRQMTGTLVYNFTARKKTDTYDFDDLFPPGTMLEFNIKRTFAELDIERGKNDEAITALSAEIEKAPRDYLSMADRALAYYFKKDLVHAMADAQNALKLKSDIPLALAVRAVVERDRSQQASAKADYALAIKAATDVINEYPKVDDPLSNRAEIYRLWGDRDKTIADYRALVLLDPKNQYLQKRLDSYLAEGNKGASGTDPRYTKAAAGIDALLLDFDRNYAKLKSDVKAQEGHPDLQQHEANCQTFADLRTKLARIKKLIDEMAADKLPVYEAGAAKYKVRDDELYKTFMTYGCYLV